MENTFWIMEGYNIYIWPSYFLTLLSLLYLFLLSFYRSKKAKKLLNKLIKLDENNLTEDGHPQISKNGKFLITDTYANKIGYQKLLLYLKLENQI